MLKKIAFGVALLWAYPAIAQENWQNQAVIVPDQQATLAVYQPELPPLNVEKARRMGQFWPVLTFRQGLGQVELTQPAYPNYQLPNYAILEIGTDDLLTSWLEDRLYMVSQLFQDRRISYADLRLENQAIIVQITNPQLVTEASQLLAQMDEAFIVEKAENWIRLSLKPSHDQWWFQYAIERFYQAIRQSIPETSTLNLLPDGRLMVSASSPEVLRATVAALKAPQQPVTLNKVNLSVKLVTDPKERQIIPVGTDIRKSWQRSSRKVPVLKRSYLNNQDILGAESVYVDGQPAVQIYLSQVGIKRMQNVTAKATSQEQFVLCLEDKALIVGRFNGVVENGVLQIIGFDGINQATQMASAIQKNLIDIDFTIAESSVPNLLVAAE